MLRKSLRNELATHALSTFDKRLSHNLVHLLTADTFVCRPSVVRITLFALITIQLCVICGPDHLPVAASTLLLRRPSRLHKLSHSNPKYVVPKHASKGVKSHILLPRKRSLSHSEQPRLSLTLPQRPC